MVQPSSTLPRRPGVVLVVVVSLALSVTALYGTIGETRPFPLDSDWARHFTPVGSGNPNGTLLLLENGDVDALGGADPIFTAPGEYVLTTVDLSLGGPLPLGFGRHVGGFVGVAAAFWGFYGASDSPMGANWIHNFHLLLRRVSPDRVAVYHYMGRVIFFNRTASTWTMDLIPGLYRGTPYQLVESGTKLKMMDPQLNLIFTFDGTGPVGSVRPVETIQDRNGNTHALAYNLDGTLSRVADGLGRSLEFSYTTSGSRPRISRVTDPSGRSIQFAYSGEQQTRYTDARGKVIAYTSNAASQIETITRPAGNRPIQNSYSVGRVDSQADGLGNLTRFTYGVGTTTIVDPLGNRTIHSANAQFRPLTYTDPAGKAVSYEYDNLDRRTATIDRLGDRSAFTYDSASGKVTSRRDNEGNIWRYVYTAQAQDDFVFYNMTRLDYPDGTRDEFSYDAKGNVTGHTDRAGKVWRYTYNSRGQVLTVTNPAGGVATLSYNADGTLASRQDPAGNSHSFGYDSLKRLNRISQPDGTTVQFTYDANDNLLTYTNEKGKAAGYSYDDNNNLKSLTDPLGKTWTFSYDANDNPIRFTDPLGNSATYTYDQLQRLRTAVNRNGNVTVYNYDSRGRLASIVDPEGKTWSFTYDDEGVLTSSTNPLGRTWRYSSDKQGRIRSVTDPLSNRVRLDYDALSRIVSTVNPLNETRNYGYDPRGLVSQASLPGNITASYERNDLGRITRIADPKGKVRVQAFDNQGRLISSTDPLGNGSGTTYDSRGRPKQINLPLGTLELAYDSLGLLTSLVYSDGTRLDYAYDDAYGLTAASGLTLEYDGANRLIAANGITLTRDSGARIETMTLAAAKAVAYTYDKRNLLASVADWAGGTTRFSYDDAGRLTGIVRPNGVVTAYRYDAANRLTGITETKGGDTFSSIVLTRDGAGRTREATRNVPLDPAPAQGARNLAFNDADQIAGFTYDAMGRLTAGGGRTYKWDLASRLVSYTEGRSTVSFTYDAFGNRLTRTQSEPQLSGSGPSSTGPLAYARGSEIFGSFAAGGESQTRSYVWNYALGFPSVSIVKDEGKTTRYYIHTPGGSLLYSVEESNNARRYYHYDETGSTLLLTDDQGAITDSYAYTPYGQLAGTAGTSDNPFTYVGQFGVMREPATSLYYMRARYYDASTARFLSRDPSGLDLADPKSTDPYHYAAQNPLNYVDPSGSTPAETRIAGTASEPIVVDEAEFMEYVRQKRAGLLTDPEFYYDPLYAGDYDSRYLGRQGQFFLFRGRIMNGGELNYYFQGLYWSQRGVPEDVMISIIYTYKYARYGGTPSANDLFAARQGFADNVSTITRLQNLPADVLGEAIEVQATIQDRIGRLGREALEVTARTAGPVVERLESFLPETLRPSRAINAVFGLFGGASDGQ